MLTLEKIIKSLEVFNSNMFIFTPIKSDDEIIKRYVKYRKAQGAFFNSNKKRCSNIYDLLVDLLDCFDIKNNYN